MAAATIPVGRGGAALAHRAPHPPEGPVRRAAVRRRPSSLEVVGGRIVVLGRRPAERRAGGAGTAAGGDG